MLQTTNPRINEIQVQVDNCLDLIRLAELKKINNEPAIALDDVFSDCGTYRCSYGDFVVERCGSRDKYIDSNYPTIENSNHLFGFNSELQRNSILGASSSGTLDQRIERLNTHIDSLYEQMQTIAAGEL